MAHGAKRGLARLSGPFQDGGRILFNLAFPGDCEVCGKFLETASRIPVCPECLAKPEPLAAEFACSDCGTPFLNRFPLEPDGRCALCRAGTPAFGKAYSFGSYDGPLSRLIHLFKYTGVRSLAAPLGEMMARALPNREFDVIVPIPLHWRKRWKRGFNQSTLLARELGSRSGVPVRHALLRRKATVAQAGLTNAARRKNVTAAFRIWNARVVAGKRVLLIDDVLTTGATAASAANVLRRAGAAEVTVLTLARADRRAPSQVLSRTRTNHLAVSGAS